MRYKILIIGAIAALCVLAALLDYSWRYPQRARQTNVTPTLPAPDFGFRALDTQRAYHLADFKGKTVLVNFWASWCAPCIAEFPKLTALAGRYPDRLVLILISEDETAKASKKLFAAAPNIYPAWDNGHHLAQQLFQTFKYPETYIITPDGQIQKKIIGEITDADISALTQQLN